MTKCNERIKKKKEQRKRKENLQVEKWGDKNIIRRSKDLRYKEEKKMLKGVTRERKETLKVTMDVKETNSKVRMMNK